MATIPLPQDFSEFLKLLSVHEIRYLLIGGYAVNYHGYVRATADMDIRVEPNEQNAERMVRVIGRWGAGLEIPNLKYQISNPHSTLLIPHSTFPNPQTPLLTLI